jgi:hypothetical protein
MGGVHSSSGWGGMGDSCAGMHRLVAPSGYRVPPSACFELRNATLPSDDVVKGNLTFPNAARLELIHRRPRQLSRAKTREITGGPARDRPRHAGCSGSPSARSSALLKGPP